VTRLPATVEERQEQLDRLCKLVFGKKEADAPEAEQARRSEGRTFTYYGDDEESQLRYAFSRSEKFRRCYDGDLSFHGNDQNRADLYVVGRLYWWFGDASTVDRLFRQSRLMRPKWDTKHFKTGETYGQRTIAKAVRNPKNQRAERHGGGKPPEPPGEQDWPAPIPFDEVSPGPPFPVEVLPEWLRNWVEAEAEATQTPVDLAGMLTLAAVGAAIARKFRVEVRSGWSEPTNIYAVVALPPGERKSAVFADAIAPVQEYEREEQGRMAPIIAEAASERRVLEARLKVLEARAAKEDDAAARQQLKNDAKELAKEVEAAAVPESPVMVCDDETPASLGRLLAQHGGRVLVAAAEGTVFEMAKGRYSDTADYDVYLKAHAGDELRVGRISRGREHVIAPALSMMLAVQPDVIRGLADDATMRHRGFLARFAYSVPVSSVGRRAVGARPVPAAVSQCYRRTMLALWRLSPPHADGRAYVAHYLHFSGEADEALRDLERWVEPQLAEGAELAHLAGWAQKLAGLVARLAAILHMADCAGRDTGWGSPVAPETVEAAVSIGKGYLLPHAQAAFGIMGADSRIGKAADVWTSIVRRSVSCVYGVDTPPSFSRRDLHTFNRRAFPTANDLDPAIQLLQDYGYLKFIEWSGRAGKAQKSPRYWINPLALAAAHKNKAPRPHCTHGTHSGEE
jgi:hypothetical protein